MTSIFQITSDIEALEALIERVETEEEPEAVSAEGDLEELVNFLVESEELLSGKIDGYVSYYRHLEARADARRDEARHLTELARIDENGMERLKLAVRMVSERLQRGKLEGRTRSVTVSESKRLAVEVIDLQAIPETFKEQVISWKVDKIAVAKHITDTGEIPEGVETKRVISVRFR